MHHRNHLAAAVPAVGAALIAMTAAVATVVTEAGSRVEGAVAAAPDNRPKGHPQVVAVARPALRHQTGSPVDAQMAGTAPTTGKALAPWAKAQAAQGLSQAPDQAAVAPSVESQLPAQASGVVEAAAHQLPGSRRLAHCMPQHCCLDHPCCRLVAPHTAGSGCSSGSATAMGCPARWPTCMPLGPAGS